MSRKKDTPLQQLPGYVLPPSAMAMSAPQSLRKIGVKVSDDPELEMGRGKPSLSKSFVNLLDGPRGSIERLAFETDPALNNSYAGLYRQKLRLIPDTILKRIAIQDDLVACIVQARSNQVTVFGRPREDRFSNGFVIEPKQGIRDRADYTEEKKKELQKRIDRAIKLLSTCGHTEGVFKKDRMSFPQWLSMSCRNALVVGRLATEILHAQGMDGKKQFHSFRPIDAGTIYKAANQRSAAEAVRAQARLLLEQVKNKKLVPERFLADEYAWVQVIESRPVQAFTEDECVVWNFYPVPDVELDGYPVTPLDTMIAQVTMHINIVTHNKLYFQSGRASRGMLVIRSEDIDESVVGRLRQQFNASINNVSNAWRMPVFGIGPDDELSWVPIDNSGSRDMEFQYLTDMNARSILSAFQMSPEELPGWAYLSRGTNSQALSESNSEFKLEAHRDLGIRPLLKQFEDFLNTVILPLIDAGLSEVAVIKLVGLEAETAEKEAVRLEQDAPLHMTTNEILEKVEKKPLGREMGGDYPLSQMWQAVADKFLPVGQQLEYFLGVEGASKDPQWAYVRDPFWFQWQQLQMQVQAMQQQAQAAQQAPPPGGQPQAGGDQPQQDVPTEKQKSAASPDASGSQPEGEDLTRALDQALMSLSKGEDKLPPGRRRLLAQHRKTVDHVVDGLMEDMRRATKDIVAVADHFTKR